MVCSMLVAEHTPPYKYVAYDTMLISINTHALNASSMYALQSLRTYIGELGILYHIHHTFDIRQRVAKLQQERILSACHICLK